MGNLRYTYKIAVCSMVLLLASCTKHDILEVANTQKGTPVVISTGVSSLTKSDPISGGVKSTRFITNDVVAVSTGDNSFSSSLNLYSNYKFGGSIWSIVDGQTPLLWDDKAEPEVTTAYFQAYYPVTEGTSYTSFTLPTNQSSYAIANENDIALADYMTYEGEHTFDKSANVNLVMNRKTARVIVEISHIDPAPTIAIDNVQVHSPYSSYTSDALAGDPVQVVPYHQAAVAADPDNGILEAINERYTFLSLPTAAAANSEGNYLNEFITFTANGIGEVSPLNGPQKYTKSLKTRLEAGYSYTFKLQVTAEEIILQDVVVVEDWLGAPVNLGDIPVHTYYIYDEQDLNEFAQLVNIGGHREINGILMNDIALSGDNWIPIGNLENAFAGTFKSDASATGDFGYTISNFGIKSGVDYQGFFGHIDGSKGEDTEVNTAFIERFTLTGTSVTATGDNVGLFAGSAAYVTFTNCSVSTTSGAFVKSTGDNVGGLTGKVGAEVVLVASPITLSEINVEGINNVGGLAGYVEAGDNDLVVLNHFSLTVEGMGNNVGGAVGLLGGKASLTITNAASTDAARGYTTTISGLENVGGIIGLVEADVAGKVGTTTISETWTTTSSKVTGTSNVGGLIGANLSATTVIEAARNDATVTGTNNIGGLVGVNGGIIVASYNTARVLYKDAITISYADAKTLGSSIMGGIAGEVVAAGRIIGCFNVGEVLVKAVASHAYDLSDADEHDNILTHKDILPATSTVTASFGEEYYYGFKGDGIVGEVKNMPDGSVITLPKDGGNVIFSCYYNDGAVDHDIDNLGLVIGDLDINNFCMTNSALCNGAPSYGLIAPVRNMTQAIESYYRAEGLTIPYKITSDAANVTGSDQNDVRAYPYLVTHNYSIWDLENPGKIIGGKHSGENSVNITNNFDALTLISALALDGMGYSSISADLEREFKNKYAPFFVDVNLLIDVNFAPFASGAYASRVSDPYYGVFNGHNRFVHNYSGNDPFFHSISVTEGALVTYIGTFKNTTFVKPTVTGGTANDIGAILGTATYGTVINNLHIIDGSVEGGNRVGAIVGYTESDVTNCSVTRTIVTGDNEVGGVAGVVQLVAKDTEAEIIKLLKGGTILPFGSARSSAIVTAEAIGGVAGGMTGRASADFVSNSFQVNAYNVSFSGEVKGDVVGAIAGVIETSQNRFGFHGIENMGKVTGTSATSIVGGLVGIGRLIQPNHLSTDEANGAFVTTLELTGIAMSNAGEIATSAAKPGSMIGAIDLNGAKLSSLSSTVIGSYEAAEGATKDAFILFTGNAADLKKQVTGGNVTENFVTVYLDPLPAEIYGYPENTFKQLSGGVVNLDAIEDINKTLKGVKSPFEFGTGLDDLGVLKFRPVDVTPAP